MEKYYSHSFAAHYAKSNKCSSVIMKLKWNMKLLYFAANVFCKYSLKQRRSEVKQENGTQCGWHWIILLPGSGRHFGGGRKGQRLRFWSPAWHMCLLWSYNGDPLLLTPNQTFPPRRPLTESLSSQEQCCATEPSAVTKCPIPELSLEAANDHMCFWALELCLVQLRNSIFN